MSIFTQDSLMPGEAGRPEGETPCGTLATVPPWEVGDSVSPLRSGTEPKKGSVSRKIAGQARARRNRALRYSLRRVAQNLTSDQAVMGCGAHVISASVDVMQKAAVNGHRPQAYYRGLMTCGKLWKCPVCAAKIRHKRSQEVEYAVAQHLAAGGGVTFVTMTVRHRRETRLTELYPAVAKAWRHVFSGAPGQRLVEEFGMIGRIRANEITWGRTNGFHPHIHVLFFTDKPLVGRQIAQLKRRLYDRWAPKMEQFTGLRPSWERGVDVRPVLSTNGDALAKYVMKVQDRTGKERSVGMEMTRLDLKRDVRKDNVTPFEMLEEIADHEQHLADGVKCLCKRYAKAWHWYEQATERRRAIEWSKGLRERFGIDEEQAPEVEAAEGSGDDAVDEVLAAMTFDQWYVVRGKQQQIALLEIAEDNGAEAARGFIADLCEDNPVMHNRALDLMARNSLRRL